METQAAILWERNAPWSVETVELDPPKAGEVLVELHASGMCHTEEHILLGDMPFQIPFVGGHEGAGVVKQVGEHVSWLQPGDHVVFSFVPACGRCPSCSTGHQNLCDLGALIGRGRQILDGGSRHHARGQDLSISSALGTFAHHTVVNEASCVKIEPHHALDRACLLGCGFVTGWGASVYAAEIEPGHNVVVAGLGGIGAAALQGAKLSGARTITVIDPSEFKREKAIELGATHVAASWEEAAEVVKEATWNRGADRFICAMGVGEGKLIARALRMVAKRGWLVVANMHRLVEKEVSISMMDLALMEKRIVGTLYGSGNPRADIPKMLELWSSGSVDLDAMVTRTYPLEKINDGFDDMRAARNIRGVLRYPAAEAAEA
ncbi:S-(hydroxymethyl)glutathione dehydrogenase / alcohol dehydrogenase [Rhodococcus rhodochrous J3]|uniref:alcohol dehydrogenase n=2 Tax=Rhodococcus rhodochrous TaxID=1829 RepID=A0AA46X0G9_RHORH|nr:NDMA-dependent alcohol dehydrogenase [Rhodococcus rhodochrous]MBF4476482.1 NDMA-dependent alcohol dehydrogenase [Rhodococcus rhodochrous]MCD2099315.1 NDMA-dependent alcohol dehydrogenase [Rhodococcus rhodochrous]MCD2123680.1 NDMA-dependent alcohol dehydrogenase [Rhodococcus rhodochrous]MCQ4136291.1 NDMA-dependent alcohol dehydrogenase [Rhodococcus rhodochrous]MDJ0020476.1 NDMA-dependent alcohol dehydrogenase [Rhodococcus rhodochrous]